MIVKLTSEQIALVGATSATDFAEKYLAHVQEAKELKDMADQSPDFSALEKRIKALEGNTSLTEARIKEIVSAEHPALVTAWAGSDAGKKLIGAEASRITLEALAAVGTTPAKPSPAAPATPPSGPKTFAELLDEKVRSGAKKTDAILALATTHAKEYQEFLKTGGKL